jgi:predicted ATP-grasp superfamily ATP-dependent carboligase
VITEIRAGRLSPLAYLGSLRGPIEFAVLAADDPVPALLELPATAYLLAKRRAGIARRPLVREPDVVGAPASRRAEPS